MPQVSREQIDRAKSVDLLSYLQTYEPHSIRKSGRNEYCLVEHDSLKISNGKFHWFSRGVGGYSTLDFLVKVRGMEFVEAVQALTDGQNTQSRQSQRLPPKINSPPKQPKPFTLPTANANNDRVIAYLRGRGIDRDVIKRCIEAGTLYESKSHCIFVGFDGDTPRFACERGTTDDYKKDVSGSDKRFSFFLPPNNPDSHSLAVTEAPADALAHATIHKMNGDKWDGYRLSLGGCSSLALISFLERHSEINSVQLCLDADKAGRDATSRIIRELLSDKRFSHLKITVAPPPRGKDYADTLGAILQLNKEKTRSDRQKRAVNFI